jgi:hypothetical protein
MKANGLGNEQVDLSMPMNFYGALRLSPYTFKTRDLKANYRELSLQYHPDKLQNVCHLVLSSCGGHLQLIICLFYVLFAAYAKRQAAAGGVLFFRKTGI